jgi:hypothetical protein
MAGLPEVEKFSPQGDVKTDEEVKLESAFPMPIMFFHR